MASVVLKSRQKFPLAGRNSMIVVNATGQSGSTQTTVVIPVDGVAAGDKIVVTPMTAKAADLAPSLHAACSAANQITLTFDSATTDGTEEWTILVFATN